MKFLRKKTRVCSLAVALAAGAGSNAAADEATSPLAAIIGGTPILELRPRLEIVDQANFPLEADAYTLRSHFGWETKSWEHLKLLIEGANTLHFGSEHYNTTVNGQVHYPTVADPDFTRLNRLQLTWAPSKDFSATVGRQRILLDDQRFVGDANWRQDEQTFDAVRLDGGTGKLRVTVLYVDRVNRTVGETADYNSDSWLVNATYPFSAAFKPTAFLYAMDFRNAKAASNMTYGLRVVGKAKADEFGFAYAASYAHQKNYRNSPMPFSLDYWEADGAVTYGPATVKAGYESLQGNGARGFVTPLATLHLFEGSADVFLTTPATGIEDKTLSIIVRPPVRFKYFANVEVLARYHAFDAQTTGAGLGHEGDVQATAAFTKKLTGLAGFADYRGVAHFPSREKVYLGLDFNY